MQIEVIIKDEFDESGHKRQSLVIDGIEDDSSSIIGNVLWIEKKEIFERIIKFPIEELSKFFNQIYYSFNVEWCEYSISLQLITNTIDLGDESIDSCIMTNALYNYFEWRKPYAFKDLANT